MSEDRNDAEFVEIHVDAPAAADPVTPDHVAEAEADADAVDAAGNDAPEGEKPDEVSEPEAKPDGDKPLRDDGGRFKGGVQGRIDELTKARREAERNAAYWQGIATQNGAKPGDDAAPTSEPHPDDFDDYGDFVKASARWAYADEQRKSIDTRVSDAASAVETHRAAEWGGKISAAKAAIPDFDAVMDAADTPTLPHVAQAIMDADRGPELLYHLAKPGNETIVAQLNEMSPYRAAMELGRIEATLEAPAAPPKPRDTTTTKAPAPITPLAPGSTTTKNPSDMPMDEYMAYREKQGIR